jgi:D-alanyl-D-alanine carboxypeptidase/D-alanyl-D-alanine-endopeptidase (penicillin-binding protein 4)
LSLKVSLQPSTASHRNSSSVVLHRGRYGYVVLGFYFLLCLISCGAKRHAPGAPGGTDPVFSETFTDTSQFAMNPNFKGWSGDTARALNNLRQQIETLIATGASRNVVTTTKIVFFEPDNAIHPIYARDADLQVLPASVEKLFTSSSTIWALGSHYAFTTKLDLAPKATINGSQIHGDLYLRPSGDPTLRTTDFDLLAQQLRDKGITTITGDIISDIAGEAQLSAEAKSYMAELNLPAPPTKDSVITENGLAGMQGSTVDHGADSLDPGIADSSALENEDEQSEAGALSSYPNFALDRNIVTVTVAGGGSAGSPASVRVYPPLANFVIQNGAKSSAAATRHVRVTGKGRRKRTRVTYTSGANTLRVSTSGGPTDAAQVIRVTGLLPARTQRTYSFVIRNVPMAMAAVAKWRLSQNGITVTGQPRVDRSPNGVALTTVALKQTSLVDLLTQMNKRSDNYLAESMFRKLSTIATVAATEPDDRARKIMRSWLQVCNVDGNSCTFIDGSGLSKMNRTTAGTVIDLLTAIRQQGLFPLFTHTLSIAGYDGTLRHRMIGTPAQYNAHGKTGTLNSVTALAGYVTTGDGQLAAYFITMQKFRGGPWAYKRVQDKIVEALASFRYADYQSVATMPVLDDTALK